MPVFAALVPVLVNALRIMLLVHAGRVIVGLLGFFGFNFVIYRYGVQPAMDFINDLMAAGPSGTFGATALQWMGLLRMDQAVSMVLSTFVAVQGIKQGKVLLGKISGTP